MCGIAGWLGTPLDDGRIAARMALAMRHRGPDAQGIQAWPEVTLIHTRLSILDLSPAGAQPMANEDGTVWTVFNGEIYNHREIRRYLEGRGHIFKGQSDTEVLPHLYEEEGLDLVEKLRGMFALAIYDLRKRTLLLARDRFGIKPLFYAATKQRLAFASEIRTLLELPAVDDRPDKQAISDFAALLYIPAPETFYVGIRALQPGELLEANFDSHGVSWKTRIYHQWKIEPDLGMTLAKATDRVDGLLTAAVRRQMESDVPLGALLSGGIDSSLVSTAAQEAVHNGFRTFNVRFSEKEYDETWAALAVSKHIGSHHETLEMEDAQGNWDQVIDLLMHAGQPFADTSLFAVNAVCRLMRKHVTVALSGDGGDEGFGGYKFYGRLALIARLQKLPVRFCRGVGAALAPLARMGIVHPHRPKRIQAMAGADDTALIQNLFCLLDEDEHQSLCREIDVLPVRRLFERQWEYHLPRRASQVEALSAHATEINVRLQLPNDFLFKVDTASMRQSLEVRVPMLDEDLFTLGLSLPHNLKVRGQECKVVLRAVASRCLPLEVARKAKQGFAIPLDTWVDSTFKSYLRDTLLGPSSRLPDFFTPQIYRPVLDAFCDGRSYPGVFRDGLFRRAIMLLSFHVALSCKRAQSA
jgi:asparagine synthase (glutamine-hydrolysing)